MLCSLRGWSSISPRFLISRSPSPTRFPPGTTARPRSDHRIRARGDDRRRRRFRSRRRADRNVFDNDGTLWCEQPMYFQVIFAFDRIKAMAPKHPEWKDTEPFKSVLDRRPEGAWRDRREGAARDHGRDACRHDRRGVQPIVTDWIATRPASTISPAVQPVRLPADARAARVSAGQRLQDVHRLRRRHRVHAAVGREGLRHSAGASRRQQRRGEVRDGCRTASRSLLKSRRSNSSTTARASPSASTASSAAGRSWRSATPTATCRCCNVHDGRRRARGSLSSSTTPMREREYAYDRQSHVGKLDKALDEATAKGWTVVDMKKDWNTIFRLEK